MSPNSFVFKYPHFIDFISPVSSSLVILTDSSMLSFIRKISIYFDEYISIFFLILLILSKVK